MTVLLLTKRHFKPIFVILVIIFFKYSNYTGFQLIFCSKYGRF